MHITDDVCYVGVNDHDIALFESQYPVPDGVSYNSYVILDEKIAVLDAVDAHFGDAWLKNVRQALDGRQPDFLIVHHMEPDHSASIDLFMDAFPQALIVSSQKAFPMMKAFFGTDYAERRIVVKEGDILSLGKHTLSFIAAPMVHWPEVIMTWDQTAQILFPADAFGKFGALDVEDNWANEARRYYYCIVGKYGAQVQAVLKKAGALDLRMICPLHGPALKGAQLTEALRLYSLWAAWQPEDHHVTIVCASIYGNTLKAAEKLADVLKQRGEQVTLHDLTHEDMSFALADVFRSDRVVLAASTYNADVFPPMRSFIHGLTERGFRGRTVGLMENGSWAPMAAKVMRGMLDTCKELHVLDTVVTVRSALSDDSNAQLNELAEVLK